MPLTPLRQGLRVTKDQHWFPDEVQYLPPTIRPTGLNPGWPTPQAMLFHRDHHPYMIAPVTYLTH